MIITNANLDNIRVGFKSLYQSGLPVANSQWAKVAQEERSTSASEVYGFLGEIDQVREWVGPRHIKNLEEHDFAIKNVDHELTIGVDRNKIEDDNLNIYSNRFRQMGKSVGSKYDISVFSLLKQGFSTNCYDGQFFFDTDHPVKDENGVVQSVANTDGGSGTPWFLLDTSQVYKPIILQIRKPWEFVSKDQSTDDNVFNEKLYVYGVDGRFNVGFGLWQFAWGSKQNLTKDTYQTAREAMMAMKADHGTPLGSTPNLLIVPPTLERDALEILNAERDGGGDTNVYKDTAELVVSPWLAYQLPNLKALRLQYRRVFQNGTATFPFEKSWNQEINHECATDKEIEAACQSPG